MVGSAFIAIEANLINPRDWQAPWWSILVLKKFTKHRFMLCFSRFFGFETKKLEFNRYPRIPLGELDNYTSEQLNLGDRNPEYIEGIRQIAPSAI
jgi:hypothetical protein